MAPKQKVELVAEILAALDAERVRLGLSREAFCAKGKVSYQTWLYWNTGETAPNLITLEKLLKAHDLHVSVTSGAHSDYSESTRFIANLIEILPDKMRLVVRDYVLQLAKTELHRRPSRPPAPR